MSNSIWKMPDLKPEENKLIFAQHDRQRDGNIDYFIWDLHEFSDSIRKDSIRWCYLDDLIAQADKAERAIWWLKEIVENHRYTPITTAEMALKELDGANK